MAKLSENTVVISDGDIKLYKRKNSSVWQAKFKLDNRWVRVSTDRRKLDEAKAQAKEQLVEYKIKLRNQIPVVTKTFASIAKLAIAEMHDELQRGGGTKSLNDYIIVINKYLIPYFGKRSITSIDYEAILEFDKWRTKEMKREPHASTINTHNSALNRIFEAALKRGFVKQSHIPKLVNKKRDSERRPDFTIEEYRVLIRKLKSFVDASRDGKSREMRMLMRDYVLVLANTGMREGTETANLKWKHVQTFEEDGQTYLAMHVQGKTGPREIICRSNALTYLNRIHERSADLNKMTFDQLLKAKINKPVFSLADGTVTKNLRQTFKAFLKFCGLLECPRTGKDRTLYSLRHTYATFALTRHGADIHALAKQMGTSVLMIERHYSHLTPRLKKEMFAGIRRSPNILMGSVASAEETKELEDA
jgi:integrase